jgi:hypothetical protein
MVTGLDKGSLCFCRLFCRSHGRVTSCTHDTRKRSTMLVLQAQSRAAKTRHLVHAVNSVQSTASREPLLRGRPCLYELGDARQILALTAHADDGPLLRLHPSMRIRAFVEHLSQDLECFRSDKSIQAEPGLPL